MTTHDLKVWPEEWRAIVERRKTFEYRKDDRGFAVRDLLHLREWDPATEDYTNQQGCFVVTYILRGPKFGLHEGHVIMSISRQVVEHAAS